MPKVQVVSEMNLDQVLNGVAQLDTETLEEFLQQVSHLLARISHPLPPAIQARYRELNAKLHDEIITEAEHQEFLRLVDEVELADARRLQRLIELAQLRGVSLDTLMEQLGLRVPADA
jgi:hypothetical protein